MIDRHDPPVSIHHEDGIGHKVEKRLVPRLRGNQLLRPLGHGRFELARILLELPLQLMPFGYVPDERAGVDDAAALLVEQCGRMDFDVDLAAILCQKHRFNRIPAHDHQPFKIAQDRAGLIRRHQFPEPHRQHLVKTVPEFLQPGLIHMDESPSPIQLINHFRRMLDQVPVFFLQPPDLEHPLFDLRKRQFQIGGHLVEGPGQMLDLIAGPDLQRLVEPATGDLQDAVVQNFDRPGDPPGHDQTGAHQHGKYQ